MLDSLASPPILFFFLGLVATLLGSKIEIPEDIKKFMSIYLLIAIGYKGGYKIYENGLDNHAIIIMVICVLFSLLMPFFLYKFLKKFVLNNGSDAIVISASFSSVSAVTFITALNLIISENIPYNGYMIVALTLMEFPAIISGIIIYNFVVNKQRKGTGLIKYAFKRSILDYSVVLLLGSLFIGFVCGDLGNEDMSPLTSSLFKGFLSIFLLGMGITAGNQVYYLKKAGVKLILFSILMPVIFSLVAIMLGFYIGMNQGNTLLLAMLFGSASYIAVPAALSESIKDANIGLMVSVALIVTFTFNICVGIPLYSSLIQYLF